MALYFLVSSPNYTQITLFPCGITSVPHLTVDFMFAGAWLCLALGTASGRKEVGLRTKKSSIPETGQFAQAGRAHGGPCTPGTGALNTQCLKCAERPNWTGYSGRTTFHSRDLRALTQSFFGLFVQQHHCRQKSFSYMFV